MKEPVNRQKSTFITACWLNFFEKPARGRISMLFSCFAAPCATSLLSLTNMVRSALFLPSLLRFPQRHRRQFSLTAALATSLPSPNGLASSSGLAVRTFNPCSSGVEMFHSKLLFEKKELQSFMKF
jgi:hypothetical protein